MKKTIKKQANNKKPEKQGRPLSGSRTTLEQEPITKKGLVICNIGAGKGKTTAAIGTAIRASGAGMNVFILQLVKAKKRDDHDHTGEGEWPLSAEIDFLNKIKKHMDSGLRRNDTWDGLGRIDNEQVGLGFVGILGDKKDKAIHEKAAIEGLNRARQILISKQYDVVILDEVVSALEVKLITEQDIINLIKLKPYDTHLFITGHNYFPGILKLCDMVTEMKMVQHPYYKGILAQRGIDY